MCCGSGDIGTAPGNTPGPFHGPGATRSGKSDQMTRALREIARDESVAERWPRRSGTHRPRLRTTWCSPPTPGVPRQPRLHHVRPRPRLPSWPPSRCASALSCCALPSSRRLSLSVTMPATSLALPLTSLDNAAHGILGSTVSHQVPPRSLLIAADVGTHKIGGSTADDSDHTSIREPMRMVRSWGRLK